MTAQLGQHLIEEGVITQGQHEAALKRQRMYGQRLSDNLLALGYLSAQEMSCFLKKPPLLPKSPEETGLDPIFVADLVLKHSVYMGEFGLAEMAEQMCLPVTTVESALEFLRREKLVEVTGATQISNMSFRYKATGLGKGRAGELFKLCAYCGPAPVSLEDYCAIVEGQDIKNMLFMEEALRNSLEHLTLPESVFHQLGPAISSGRPIFLYGPPGNGKTAIAVAISEAMPGSIYIPFSIQVGGQIINVFDKVNHVQVSTGDDLMNLDKRWVEIKRPVIVTGGELTLKMLDLQYNAGTVTYEAPMQMKANNGILVIDDFGRQQVNPHDLLNRWIVCLERNIDFLTLHTGMKFTIPFNQIVLFSTNLEPRTLVDEAFLRRISYKIKIDYPTAKIFQEIFERVCLENDLQFDLEVFNILIRDYYQKYEITPSACQARDIVTHIVDYCRYFNQRPQMSLDHVAKAWEEYFLAR